MSLPTTSDSYSPNTRQDGADPNPSTIIQAIQQLQCSLSKLMNTVAQLYLTDHRQLHQRKHSIQLNNVVVQSIIHKRGMSIV